LCAECNNRLAQYDLQYAPFVRDVAERVSRVNEKVGKDAIQVQVRYPIRVLKCALKSFISANGPDFIESHPWMRRFLLDLYNTEWDASMHLYLYACATRAGRQSGDARVLNVATGELRRFSEFTFWPLGNVLSSVPLKGVPLQPIDQWVRLYRYTDRGPATLSLPVNVITTVYPLDFRSAEEVRRDAEQDS